MKRFRILLNVAVVVAFLVLASSVSFAQSSNGAISGVVSDKTGAVVPGTTVTAANLDLGTEKRSATTDSVGGYRIESLLPGRYSVVFKAEGFAELKFSGVEVRGSVVTTLNATLEVSTVAATVTVEAAAEQLQTQSGELSASIGKAEILNLPFLSLNPISLVLTEPGVQSASSRDDFTNGVGFSVNGTRPRANNFLIDGQDNNDNAINGQAFQQINPEAIGEVVILTNSYSAEFGRGGGSVTNVISKGGTNEFHGALWDIHQSSALAAIDASSKAPFGNTVECHGQPPPSGSSCKPVFTENTFGFAIGGPIKKNKLFFFGTAQWDRQRQTANGSTLTLPTANGVAVLQSLNTANANFLIASLGGLRGIIPTGAGGTFATLPLGGGRPAVEIGNVQRTGVSEKSNDRQEQVRVDWQASSSNTITGRYIRDDGSLTPDFFNFANSLPPYDPEQGGPSQTGGVSWTHTFSPRAINELRFSYTSIAFTFGPTSATAANPLSLGPAKTISSTPLPTLGFNTALPQGRAHKNWQYQDVFNATLGRHSLKVGVDISHLQVVDTIPFNSRGTISYTTGGGFGPLGNFVDDFTGTTGTIAIVFGNPVLQPFVTTYAPYFQDTWKLTSNFTLDLGFRYEYWGVPENVLQFPAIDVTRGFGDPGSFPNKIQENPDKNNFAPRIGIAYTPRFWGRVFGQDKTVFRAGYGIFYDGLFTNILDNTGSTSPNAVGGTITGGPTTRGTANASAQLIAVQPRLNPRAGINSVSNLLRNPLTHQWNFNIERQIPGNFLITAAYVGTRGTGLFVNQEFNPGVNGVRVNPARGGMTIRTNGGDSIYHSAQLKVERKFTRGLLLRGSYTYSKLIDSGSEVFVTSGLTSFAQDPFNQRGERGLSAFDRRHTFALTYVWELPYVHRTDNMGWSIVKAITRDWQWSGTIFFRSGVPDTVNSGFDTFGDIRGTNDRPNLGNPSAPFNTVALDGVLFGITPAPGTFFEVQNALACDDVTIPCVPVSPTNFHFLIQPGLGNVGRNTVITPGRQDWNMAVQRSIKIPMKHLEQQALVFRGEFFNTFNHPNTGVNGVGNTPSYNALDPNFGNVDFTRFGGRIIRLWLKYQF